MSFLYTNDIPSRNYMQEMGCKFVDLRCNNLNTMYTFENNDNISLDEDNDFKIAPSSKIRFESVPYKYDLNPEFDDRFISLRLRLQHDNINPNFTAFDLEDIKKAAPTLRNIPILANVLYDEITGEPYFGGHDSFIERDRFNPSKWKIIYKEIPVGLIPNELNYAIEEFDGRNYVVIDGLIYVGYSNYAEDLIKKDEEVLISMEIDIQQSFNLENGITKITQYRYGGITLLGNDRLPGMNFAEASIKRKRRRRY